MHTDGAWDEQHATDITQRSQAMNNDPETYYPTQSISAGSFRAESKSKVRLFFPSFSNIKAFVLTFYTSVESAEHVFKQEVYDDVCIHQQQDGQQ